MKRAETIAPDERVVGLLEALVAETRAVRTLLEAQASAKGPAEDASPTDPLLGLRELSELLDLDERSVRRMRAAGEIPEPTVGGRSPHWRREVIEAWLARRGAP